MPGEPTEHPQIPPGVYGPEQTAGIRAKLARDVRPGDVLRRLDNPHVRGEVKGVRVLVEFEGGGESQIEADDHVYAEVR
jgi:hypothetical protein